MPIDDIAGGLLGGLLRFLGWLFFDLFFEIFIKGTGYTVLRVLRPRYDASETVCAIVGLVFWASAVVIAVCVYRATLP